MSWAVLRPGPTTGRLERGDQVHAQHDQKGAHDESHAEGLEVTEEDSREREDEEGRGAGEGGYHADAAGPERMAKLTDDSRASTVNRTPAFSKMPAASR